ncbi:hypothetical protein ACROYT_G036005 [Oculina patagonica]
MVMMDEMDLLDTFREKHPNKSSFTYESKALKVKSRIDYFLVARSFAWQVSKTYIKTSIAPDHKAVILHLNLSNNKRGPGLWKFNNLLLNDISYVNLIRNSYPGIVNKYSDIEDLKLKWELIKMEIRSLTIPYCKQKARKVRELEKNLEKRLEILDEKINSCTDDANLESALKEHEYLQNELRRSYEKRAESAIFRSKVRWTEEGEKPTKYFLNMERKNYNKKIITELQTSEGLNTTDEKQMLDEIKSFYQNLYTSANNVTDTVFQEFISKTPLQFPKLSSKENDRMEGKLTFEECQNALKSMANGKSPGEDGFTVEFYKAFFYLLDQDFLNSINAAYDDGEMSISQRRGVITLIPKENTELKKLSNWRPITLLNVDYKIASKAIATRIEKFLPQLINTDQTGFMKGRF